MSMTLTQIEAEVFKLPARERIILAQELFSDSLTKETHIEKSWYDEAEKRLAAFESGKIGSVSGDEAIKRIKKRLTSTK
jgi:putative addiction module component (TIGR02574 family)